MTQTNAARLLVFGSLNIDYVYQVPHFVQPGETLHSSSRQVFAGGKGLNQGVALAQGGGAVYFLGAVGHSDGALLLDTLKRHGIALDFVKERQEIPSGHTFIQVDASGQNCILLYGGANQSHTKEEIDACLGHFGAGDYLIMQNETNEAAYAMEQAAKRGLKVCINASPLDATLLAMPLEHCAFIIVNEIEGAALAHTSAEEDPDVILTGLKERFPQSSILLTLGSHGAIMAMKGDNAAIRCPAYKMKAVDTTAAGDTFLGFFVSSLAAGVEPAEALQRATAASAIAVTRKGATPSIPNLDEVLDFIKEHGRTMA